MTTILEQNLFEHFNEVPFQIRLPVTILNRGYQLEIFNKFKKRKKASATYIANQQELEKLIDEVNFRLKYKKFTKPLEKSATFIKRILGGINVSNIGYGDFSMSFHNQTNIEIPSANFLDNPKIIVILEDQINPDTFSRFVTLYKDVAEPYRPLIVFISNNFATSLEKVQPSSGSITVHSISNGKVVSINPTVSPLKDIYKFIDYATAEADAVCSLGLENGIRDELDIIAKLTHDLIVIQSSFRSRQKYEVRYLVNQLMLDLDDAFKTNKGNLRDKILFFKGIANLWNVYINEGNQELINNTLSIAEMLGDDFLKALALRNFILLKGYSNATGEFLAQARDIFTGYNFSHLAAMTQNNINVNNLYSNFNEAKVRDFERLSESVRYDELRGIRRTTTIHSNTGIALMLAGRTEDSIPYFQEAVSGSGPPLNKFTSEMNYLIARYMEGEIIDDEIGYAFLRKIKREGVHREFDYHLTTLYANLWGIFSDSRSLSKEIKNLLIKEKFMDYGSHLGNYKELVNFIMANYPSSKASGSTTLPGKLGEFANTTGFLLAAHVYYR